MQGSLLRPGLGPSTRLAELFPAVSGLFWSLSPSWLYINWIRKVPRVPFLLWLYLSDNERRNLTIYLDLVFKFYPDIKWYFDWQAHIQNSYVIRPEWQLQAESQRRSDPKIAYCQLITSQCAETTKLEFWNLIWWNKSTVFAEYSLHNHFQEGPVDSGSPGGK